MPALRPTSKPFSATTNGTCKRSRPSSMPRQADLLMCSDQVVTFVLPRTQPDAQLLKKVKADIESFNIEGA